MAQTHRLRVTLLSPLHRPHNEALRLSFCLGDSNSFLGLGILFPVPHLLPSPGPFRCLLSSADPMCVSISTHCGIDLHEDFALQLYDYKLLKTMGYFFWKCHKAWSNS